MDDEAAFTDPANGKWVGQTDAGFAWLQEIHPSLYASGGRIQYPAKDMAALELLSSGEVWMVPTMVDDVLRGLDQQTLPATVKLCQLTDYALPGSDTDMAICATTHSADGCYDFLNFVLSTQGQQLLVASLKTIPAVDPAALEQTAEVAALGGLEPGALFLMDAGDNAARYRSRWSEEIATIG
jgi:putative spermidine/putrescine transport system substrate-binding protein